MRVNAPACALDVEEIVGSSECHAVFAELGEKLEAPAIGSARWSLLSHRPLPGARERYVTTYTVNLAVDGLGIMPDEYLGHDGDVTPEFDLKSLFASICERARGMDWKARVEVSFHLKSGMLFDLSLRMSDNLMGEWKISIEDPPSCEPLRGAQELIAMAKNRRRISITGTFTKPEEIPDDDVKARLGIITAALVDTRCEIEKGWPILINMSRYEWEE